MDVFPDDLRKFIHDKIDTIELLETLLLVRRDPSRLWTAEAVSRELYTSAAASRVRLQRLATLQLVAESTIQPMTYLYGPVTGALQDLVDRLADAYRERRVTVINHIYSKSTVSPPLDQTGG